MRHFVRIATALLWASLPLTGCAQRPPIAPVPHVDLQRYMGDWYVIASIPSSFERDAFHAVESYSLRADGRVQTTFTYREGAVTGELKTMRPIGYVRPESGNAVWGMQFIWPIKAEYIIAWLDPDYRSVIVARNKRDYVWIMSRTPTMAQDQYAELVSRVAAMGYDIYKLRKVPQ